MKHNKIFAALLGLTLIGAASCTDKWDDHYSEQSVGGNIWESISSDPNLSNFASVLTATTYDRDLASSQMFTVFAPTNDKFTQADAQALIDSYNDEIAQYRTANNPDGSLKRAKTSTVKEFVQNHIALYNYSMALQAFNDTTIRMVNGKNLPFHNGTFSGISYVNKNINASNGVLYTIDGRAPYKYNIFEYIESDSRLDSVRNFLYMKKPYTFYSEKFNASESVPGEVVDGQQLYLDSVVEEHQTVLENHMKALINSEDSTYRMVLPDNDSWKSLIAKYNKMFVYAKSDNAIEQKKLDSLSFYYPHYYIISGTCFSKTRNPRIYDTSVDSVANTVAAAYTLRKELYGSYSERKNVFMKPYDDGGIFNGVTPISCSNGDVIVTSDWRIKANQTFVNTIVREAESQSYSNVDSLSGTNKPSWITKTVTADNPYYNKVSNNSFKELSSSGPTELFVELAMPNILSNVEYELHMTTVPAIAGDTTIVAERDTQYVAINIGWKENTYKLDGKIKDFPLYWNSISSNLGEKPTGMSYNTQGSDIQYIKVPNITKKQHVILVYSDELQDFYLGRIKFDKCEYGLDKPVITIQPSLLDTTLPLRIDKIELKPVFNE